MIAREIYEFLHRPTDDDPVLRPGLEIPVEYGRDLKGLLEALERPEHHPDREPDVLARVVVLILDRGAYGRPPHRSAVTEAVKRWTPTDDAPGGRRMAFGLFVHVDYRTDRDGAIYFARCL